ncbi:right-handed parallel beta-helix repeat-containing protein (plasmid) [Halobaculum sp. CBA1158]|uniref:right-handed parallel beta-helix repeat-containing protein n=1 Tax=Halobaculum sp. CBA1158 TaxID=2904243 RepID=UPI001F285B3B|nr:right-handed parallel beta-helix repeat-containing protein [Halobaculum sp. CBA1158]UIP01518.1 right-handed parallel beta-helix repeat-containing protein [Halobaculum sp. CBA1158]
MANSHKETDASNEAPTEANDEATGATSRRTLLKGVGAFATLGGAGLLADRAAAAGDFNRYLTQSGDVAVPAGEYSWDGDDLSIGSDTRIVGQGDPGDVVVNLESGTMDGSMRGTLENVVLRGSNPSSKAGIDIRDGAVLDGFVWPEGGQRSEDRALYNPSGGERATVRNSAWAWMANNGAYTDKMPMTYENCAAVNNNIANIRIGHRESDETATTYIRNCLIAVTETPAYDDTNYPYARGIRMRQQGNFVIENCSLIFLDVDGTADMIEIHDGAAGSNVTIRDCAFYNDSDGDLVRDKSNGACDVTIENCTVEGSGSRAVEPDFSGSGFTEASATFPLPSEVTGYDAADEIDGVAAGVGPWGRSSSEEEDTGSDDPADYEHTIVLQAGEDNPVSADARVGDFDMRIDVSGGATYGETADPRDEDVVRNDDGSSTLVVNDLKPGELDSFRFDGEVTDYLVDDGYEYSVSLDGTTTTFEELVNGGPDTDEGGSTDDGSTDGSDTDDGSTGDDSTGDDSTDGGRTDDGGTGIADGDGDDDRTDDGGTGVDGGDDSTDDGSGDADAGGDGDRTDDPGVEEFSKRVLVDGQDADSPTNYTFTVSGEVVRDTEASRVTEDGAGWDRIRDIARDGKVIGLVGGGVDAYRFDGDITEVTVDGDATFTVERGL